MADEADQLFGWRDLAESLSGAVGVQMGAEFVYVSTELAATVGVESASLVGEPWRTLFDDDEARRLEREALAQAQAEGHWEGMARTGGDTVGEEAVALELSGTAEGPLVWTLSERESTDGQVHPPPEDNRHDVLPPKLARALLDAIDDIVYVIDENGEFYDWNEKTAETLGYSHEELAGIPPKNVIPTDHHKYVPGLMEAIDAIEDRRVNVDLLTADGERITHEFNGTTFEHPGTGEQFRCGVARDITERLARERKLQRQRDELSTLNRINDVLFESIDDLVETTSRATVEETVCSRLAESELYEFACTVERGIGEDRLYPRTSAGDGEGHLAAIVDADGSIPGSGPADKAIRTNEVQAVNVDTADFEPWREEALERGFESLVAVPLHYRETVYGALVVYANRPDAFSQREQHGFAILGQTVGFVINAVERRRLLFADAVTEFEFRIVSPETFLARASAEHDCRLTLRGHVSVDDQWIFYVDVDGVAVERIVDAATDDPTIDSVRTVSGDETRLELVAVESSFMHRMAPTGVHVRSVEFEGGSGHLVVESPAETDTRDILKRFETMFGSTELLARRKYDRSPDASPSPVTVTDTLTDRQREALEAAYRAGYFEWPRASTAEEIADALGITASTLHGHLRKAEETLIGVLFD